MSDGAGEFIDGAFSFMVEGGIPAASTNKDRYEDLRWFLVSFLRRNSESGPFQANQMGYLIRIMRGSVSANVGLPQDCIVEPIEGRGVTFHNPNSVLETEGGGVGLCLLRSFFEAVKAVKFPVSETIPTRPEITTRS